MRQEELFAMAIGINAPWFIEDVSLDLEKSELNIKVDFKRGALFPYSNEESGITGEYKAYDTTIKTWRHMNFFQYRCYIHARIPRVDIGDGVIKQVKTSWEDCLMDLPFCLKH